MRGTFELAGEQAVDEVFGLILRRIDWMDEKGIRQWNVTGYAEAYPKTHYQEQARLGRLYRPAGAGWVLGGGGPRLLRP